MNDDTRELREIIEAAEKLARNPEAFKEAVDALRASAASRFQAVLDRAGLLDRCHLICRFLCEKHCLAVCRRFCPGEPRIGDVDEMRAFAQALTRLLGEPDTLGRLLDIIGRGDEQGWRVEISRLELGPFCHQLCHFLCAYRCRLVCRELCPPRPEITRVGSIPVTQISLGGLGNGPSIPPFQVAPPDPPAGRGDHPFGSSIWLMGVFNMPTATQYRVEVAPAPAGPYTPIAVPVPGYNVNPTPPPINLDATRFPSGGADPGWFDVADIHDSDGGPNALGEKTLVYWPSGSVPDGLHYVRLSARDGVTTRMSAPQPVKVDNTAPGPFPLTISLQLQRPDGSRVPLKCGKVRKGDGVIVVTIHAFDVHFSRIDVAAQGNSGLSVPIVDTSAVPLSKTYNGNLADLGYPVPTEFLWDPWSDPRIVPCCYVVRVDIWDRAVLNNTWSGGHGNSGWEAIEIGF
jgi:hypothetical protein